MKLTALPSTTRAATGARPERVGPPSAAVLERRALLERRAPALRELYPFASHELPLGEGGALHVLDEGPRTAPVLLCLHGNPTWSFTFRHVVAARRATHRVVVPDHAGCGLSLAPAGFRWTLAERVAHVERLVRALELDRITLVLHDWGGAIGMGVARRLEERVARLVVLNTAAFPARAMPLRIAACRVPLLGTLAVRGLDAFAGLAPRMAVARPLAPAVAASYRAPYASWREREAVARFVHDIPMSARHPSWAELAATGAALARFADRPALVVWGERDWCFTPEFRREWERRLPRAESHPQASAGHWVQEDAAAELDALLADFLARTEAP